MRNSITKLAVVILGLAFMGTANAMPITGKIQIVSSGNFVDSSGNATTDATAVTGFDFSSTTGGVGYFGVLPTGAIYDMIVAAGSTFPNDNATMSSFNLANIPPAALEWSISPVQVASGASGELTYTITGGGVTDAGSGTGNFDLGGNGYFSFVCSTNCGLQTSSDTKDQTVGKWSISNTASGTLVTLTNVPAPATIGILGLALLGIGIFRRRSVRV